MSPHDDHDDLSIEVARRFLTDVVIGAVVALVFIGFLHWTLSATTSSPSLVGTGARGLLPAVAPVPYFSPEERVDA